MIAGRIDLGDHGPYYTPLVRSNHADDPRHRVGARNGRRKVVVIAPRLYTGDGPWLELDETIDTIVARHGRHRFFARARLVTVARLGTGCDRPLLVPESVVRAHNTPPLRRARPRPSRQVERAIARARFRPPASGRVRSAYTLLAATVAVGLLGLWIVEARSARHAAADARRLATTTAQTIDRDVEQRRLTRVGVYDQIALMERHVSIPYVGLLSTLVATLGEDDRIVRFTAGNHDFNLVALVSSPVAIANLHTIDLVSDVRYITRTTPEATTVEVSGRIALEHRSDDRAEPQPGSAPRPAEADAPTPDSLDALVERRDVLLASFAPPQANASDLAETLAKRASDGGVDLRSLGVDVGQRRIEIGVSGPPARVAGWLVDAERTVLRAGVRVERVTASSGSPGAIDAALTAVYDRVAGPASAPVATTRSTGPTRSDVMERSDRWVRASADEVARAFSVAPIPVAPVALDDAPQPAQLPRPTGPRYVGRVGGDIDAYAFRFPESPLVRAIAVGQTAFGWRLVAVTGSRFDFEKEGYQHDTYR